MDANGRFDDQAEEARRQLPSVGWMADGEIAYAEWLRVGRHIGAIGRVSSWWLGDWLRYGVRFESRYSVGARVTRYDAQTLMNMVYVSTRFSVSRRREDLSWSHHAEVASLCPAEQDRWLARAASSSLSVRELRAARAAERRPAIGDHLRPSDAAVSQRPTVRCPHCGQRFDAGVSSGGVTASPVPRAARPSPPPAVSPEGQAAGEAGDRRRPTAAVYRHAAGRE